MGEKREFELKIEGRERAIDFETIAQEKQPRLAIDRKKSSATLFVARCCCCSFCSPCAPARRSLSASEPRKWNRAAAMSPCRESSGREKATPFFKRERELP